MIFQFSFLIYCLRFWCKIDQSLSPNQMCNIALKYDSYANHAQYRPPSHTKLKHQPCVKQESHVHFHIQSTGGSTFRFIWRLCGETAERSSKIKHVLSLKLSDGENHTLSRSHKLNLHSNINLTHFLFSKCVNWQCQLPNHSCRFALFVCKYLSCSVEIIAQNMLSCAMQQPCICTRACMRACVFVGRGLRGYGLCFLHHSCINFILDLFLS